MANEREYNPHRQPGTENLENDGEDRAEQFNELSELSLEERMNVADQIGIPVGRVSEAVATGTMSGPDDAEEGLEQQQEEENEGEV